MEQDQVLSVYDALNETGALKQLEEYKHKADTLQELVEQSVELFTKRTEDELISYIVTSLLQAFVPTYVAVFLEPPDGNAPVRTICYRNLKPAESPVELTSIDWYRSFFGDSPASAPFETAREVGPSYAEQLEPLDPELIIPLQGLNGLYGVVVIGTRVLGEPYTAEEREYIDQFFIFASIGLQNVMHYVSAVTDYKTRLYNHSFFTQRLSEELHKLERHGTGFAILEIDIDHFKRLNDYYGHLAGDAVLFQFARILEHSVRTEDVVSRYGGEEFLAVLVECPPGDAQLVANRIRHRVEETEFHYGEEMIRMTVSIGVTFCRYAFSEEPSDLITRADFALYEAKNRGRNQVHICRPGLLGAACRHKVLAEPAAMPVQR